MTTLARKLRATDYFTLGWGTMVGVGWLVIMDDWLLRGGALGAVLGFVIGGALLLPVGWVYGKLVVAMPDAAGEIAYTSAVFPRSISFATGWMMTLAYFIVCPWEAVAIGRIAAYILPSLDSVELYRIAGRPVYLPHLVVGLGLTALLTILNYRGVRLSATFQNWTSFGTLALFVMFVALGVSRGSPVNFPPLFTHAPLISILLVIQIVPYFMMGFESVGKAAEEARPDFRAQGFFRAIWMAIFIGILFYAIIVAAVAFVAPWHLLTGEKFMTAIAFQQAVGARWIVNIILVAAMLSLFKCFNGNFVAASRLLFALGRRQMVNSEGKFAPGSMVYFVLRPGDSKPTRAERMVDYLAEHAYSITLAVSLGQIKTLIEHPFSMTHSALPDEQKRAFGMHPEGIRISLGLEDWHDIIRDLELALEKV